MREPGWHDARPRVGLAPPRRGTRPAALPPGWCGRYTWGSGARRGGGSGEQVDEQPVHDFARIKRILLIVLAPNLGVALAKLVVGSLTG